MANIKLINILAHFLFNELDIVDKVIKSFPDELIDLKIDRLKNWST